MFLSKIDSNILRMVSTESCRDASVSCLIYTNNFDRAKKHIEKIIPQGVTEYPFINAFGVKTNISNIHAIATKNCVSYISSTAKVFAQMDITRKVMNIDKAQEKLSGSGVTVAVIDTGIREHLDFCSFENRIVFFKDFVNQRTEPYDDNGHGTFVSGVLAGNGFSSGGKYCGVAPKSKIIMLKALDANGETGAFTILEAMQWVYDNRKKYNIKIVCMSFGSQPLAHGDPLMLGAEALWNSGIIVVAAGGNNGPSPFTIKSPGSSGKIITVGALDDGRENGEILVDNFKIADFSSRGPAANFYKPDCVACGVDIVCTSGKTESQYIKMSGTSVATPIVAGSCALLLEKSPKLTPMEVKSRMMKSCFKVNNHRNDEGFGVLDVSKFVGA